ncbi:GldG family protein [Paludibaculum fermentans]|uniref:GldG family protein n=1 Tax=Paludibaculum fermentans TaxID=1473598 RepID=A0A7S7NKV7_PALFE|nr:GldG family protein [Paludibaculum fermentans]QOY84959.1 GldG family protein [Paludibaculum fermentans]
MSNTWMKSRQTKYTAYAGVYIVVIIAVLATVNFLANRYNKSFDATSNKRYSLSDQTIKLVSGLKQDVTISYFDETTGFAKAKDLLDRYDNLSTKLSVVYIDPFKKPQLAKQFGITQTGTIVLQSGDKRQEARSVSEEELTSAIIRLQKTGDRTACFTTGAGEHSLEDTTNSSYAGVKELVEKNNYKTQVINLIEKPEVPAGCSLVVVAGPKVDYPQPVVDALKKYIEDGGRGLFLSDPPLKTGKETVAENKALLDVLNGWGVTLQANLILDTSGLGGLYGMGPEVALATRYETHPIVREMKRTATAFPLVRSLDVKPTDKTTAEKLASTSKNSIAATNLNAAGGAITMPKGDTQSYTVAAAGTYRTGKQNNNNNVEGRFIVVGSSDWISNYALGFGGNRDLVMNMLNWLTNDEDLISIRPKDPEDRRIQLTGSQMLMVRMVSQFLIPIFVIIFGIMVWWRRR